MICKLKLPCWVFCTTYRQIIINWVVLWVCQSLHKDTASTASMDQRLQVRAFKMVTRVCKLYHLSFFYSHFLTYEKLSHFTAFLHCLNVHERAKNIKINKNWLSSSQLSSFHSWMKMSFFFTQMFMFSIKMKTEKCVFMTIFLVTIPF